MKKKIFIIISLLFLSQNLLISMSRQEKNSLRYLQTKFKNNLPKLLDTYNRFKKQGGSQEFLNAVKPLIRNAGGEVPGEADQRDILLNNSNKQIQNAAKALQKAAKDFGTAAENNEQKKAAIAIVRQGIMHNN